MSRPGRRPLRGAFHFAHVVAHALFLARHRLRRRRLLVALRVRAAWHRASLDLHLASDLRLGRRVAVVLSPGRAHRLWIGPGCSFGDGARLELGGGSVFLGEGVEVRRGADLRVSGHLSVLGPALLGQGATVHCDESVRLAERVGIGEYVTIADSSHRHADPSTWFVHHVVTAPVVVDHDVWLAAKATVTRGVHIGAHAVVAANSAVVHDVPAGAVVSGVPAQVVVQPRSAPAVAASSSS